MTRWKLTIEYDGTGICGWQRQKDMPSVQGFLEIAAEKLNGEFQDVVGAGRTDAGVHAMTQVAHVDFTREFTPFNVVHGLNYHLQPLTANVIVTKAEAVADDFHARFSATSRTYCYHIINRPARLALEQNRAWHVPELLDVRLMHNATRVLVGTHDFTTFRSTLCQSKSPIKTLDVLNVVSQGDTITIHTQARSFLHNQVRNMAGALRLIGNGKWKESDLESALLAKDRTKGAETAPPDGLYLVDVGYKK